MTTNEGVVMPVCTEWRLVAGVAGGGLLEPLHYLPDLLWLLWLLPELLLAIETLANNSTNENEIEQQTTNNNQPKRDERTDERTIGCNSELLLLSLTVVVFFL